MGGDEQSHRYRAHLRDRLQRQRHRRGQRGPQYPHGGGI
ncbi:hypothetical protein SDC9_193206 [bioreactor metagenome]|uniref:Uncharacterized protein n=1 Tax=bioreactor metagenome TaxID=1076179 RepID=A0A645I314_9ZZZZ